MRPSISTRIEIAGPAGPLQSIVEDVGDGARGYAVVCHPHPLYGGTMDNKVVVTIARTLHELGISTVRFNFRGVGTSAGSYDEGRGESADALSVADWAAQRWAGLPLLSAGFSFGSYVALRLALSRPSTHLITVAPAVTRFNFHALERPATSWIVVQGLADEVIDSQAVVQWAERLEPPPRLRLVPAGGHFFHGKLLELKQILIDEIRSGNAPLRA